MKKIAVISSFLVMLVFLVSCAPQVSDQELQMGLDNLTDEELDQVINETAKGDAKSLAGQAVSTIIPPTIKGKVSNQRLLQNAQAVKIKRLEEKLASVIQPPDPTIPPTIQPPDPAQGSGAEAIPPGIKPAGE